MLVLFAVAAGATVAVVAWRRRAVPVQTVAVIRGDLLVRVLCDGRLEPPEGGELRTADGGTVAELPVHEGDRVNRGQVLLRLANPDLEARAREARGEVRQLQADTAAASADLDHQRHEAAYREQQLAGDRRLLTQGAIPRATLDADQLAWQQATDQTRAAEARLESLRKAPDTRSNGGIGGDAGGSGGAGGGGARLALAVSAAAELEGRVAALTVRAPAAGMIYGLPHAVGETVTPGALVADVTDPDHPHVRCRVDQPDLPRVAPGQKLIVTFNGLPDRQWDGAVSRVGTGLREAGGREVGEIVGELADPVHTLPANAAVDVQVVVAAKSGVLSVPRSALRRDADHDGGLPSGAPASGGGARPAERGGDTENPAAAGRYVYVVSHRHARRRDIEVGLIGLSQVEVVRGLQEGERVVAEGPPSLSEDARVSETKPH